MSDSNCEQSSRSDSVQTEVSRVARPGATWRNQIANSPVDKPTPLNGLGGDGPILANQESAAEPFRPDSQIAARPVDVPALTYKQMRAIELLLIGRASPRVADELHVSRGTVWRWCRFHPLFRAELARRRQELWGAAADRFRKSLLSAVKTLRKHLRHEHPIVQYRAARALLTLAGTNRFAPPEESVDPNDYLNEFALTRRREIHEPNFEHEPATDSERRSALATLLAKSEYDNEDRFEGDLRRDTIQG